LTHKEKINRKNNQTKEKKSTKAISNYSIAISSISHDSKILCFTFYTRPFT